MEKQGWLTSGRSRWTLATNCRPFVWFGTSFSYPQDADLIRRWTCITEGFAVPNLSSWFPRRAWRPASFAPSSRWQPPLKIRFPINVYQSNAVEILTQCWPPIIDNQCHHCLSSTDFADPHKLNFEQSTYPCIFDVRIFNGLWHWGRWHGSQLAPKSGADNLWKFRQTI